MASADGEAMFFEDAVGAMTTKYLSVGGEDVKEQGPLRLLIAEVLA